jgi:hypothetical protein
MDLNRLIQMILSRVLMRFVNRGISAGLNKVAPPPDKGSGKDMTPEERQQAKAARELQRRARQAAKLTRRF